MAGGTTTYRARTGVDPDALLSRLQREGYSIGSSDTVTRTVLDTFDGRLAATGLRLEWTAAVTSGRRPAPGELVLRGDDGVPAQVTVPGVPRVAADVPAGPLRLRLARLLDVRVLLTLVAVRAERTVATKRNAAGKTTAIAVVYDRPHVGDDAVGGTVVDAIELAGYPKPGAELRGVIEDAGFGDVATGGLTDLAAAATGANLSGRVVAPGVPLAPDLAAVEGFRRVLANLRDAIVVNWDGTVDDIDPEFLHDLRVAVRRTRSVLTNAKSVLPEAVREQARADFGWFGQITGPARDLDVYQIEWAEYTAPLAADTTASLEPVRTYLESQREVEHEVLTKELDGQRAHEIIDSWSEWLDAPVAEELPDGSDQPIGDLVAKRVRRAHRTMIRRGRTITPDTDAEVLHELRKDAKRLRYLLECFGGLYDSGPRKAFVNRLKALQDNLGEHQDAEVHVDHLRGLSGTLAPTSSTDTMLATGQLIERMEQRRISCRHEFADRFTAFDNAKTVDALAALLASAGAS